MREYGTPQATYLEVTPDPQSNMKLSPLPTSTKTLFASCLRRGMKHVPINVIRISFSASFSPGKKEGSFGSSLPGEAPRAVSTGARALLATTVPKVNPESFNNSRRVKSVFILPSFPCGWQVRLRSRYGVTMLNQGS